MPQDIQNARKVTPRKAKPTQNAPDAPATSKVEAVPMAKQTTHKVEAAPVLKQATLANQKGPEPGQTLA